MPYLDIKSWVFEKLIAYSPLITALGSANKVLSMYPNVMPELPIVVFAEANNQDENFYDNQPTSNNEAIDIHVFEDFETSTTTISGLVSDLMTSLLFTRTFSNDMDDPNIRVRHKVLKYSRNSLTSLNLV